MRFILFLFISLSLMASEFPIIFSSAGDSVYQNVHRYEKIKDMAIYEDRPEVLEAYCYDANEAMKKGFSLDAIIDDPEQNLDKALMKSYAQELRNLSKQNDKIVSQLDIAVGRMIENNEYSNLRKIHDAGFLLSDTVMRKVKKDEKSKNEQKNIKILNERTSTLKVEEKEHVAPIEDSNLVAVSPVKDSSINDETHETPKEEPVVELTLVQRYEAGLADLKEELYTAREEQNIEKTACLNDITAINYWMIKVLENEKDACEKASAIRQMKSYDKSSATSCGRTTLRYVEWHGRIKPYVGKQLFEAESLCDY